MSDQADYEDKGLITMPFPLNETETAYLMLPSRPLTWSECRRLQEYLYSLVLEPEDKEGTP